MRPSLGGLDPFFPWVQDTSHCCGHTLLRVNWWVPIGHLLAVIWMNRQNPHEVSLASLLKTQEHKEQYKQAPTHPSHPSWDLQAKTLLQQQGTELGITSPQDKTPRAEKPPLLMHPTYLADSCITDKPTAMRQPARMSHREENHHGDLGVPVVFKDCVFWGQGREKQSLFCQGRGD